MTDPRDVLTGSPYRGYVYAYPHKTAYRGLHPPRPLAEAWRDEPRTNLFLYVHVPFCTMRCGFCNLFTTPWPDANLPSLYLDALRTEAEAVRECLPDARFARFAVGGGTPTYLDEPGLHAVFDIAEQVMGADGSRIPVGVETSPDTTTPEKLAVLKARGVDRVSVGVQSFVDPETRASGRPQSRAEIDTALSLLKSAEFPTLNVDLIYGLPGQTVDTWLFSVREAMAYRPEELYLYPLYVRPLTGLGRSKHTWDDDRLACYREARALLLAEGYSQVSMRMFRRADAPDAGGPAYCCQTDGMVGLGSGARSYTSRLHYSTEYAVGVRGVRGIIADHLGRDRDSFRSADHGFELDADEQRRRYLLQSLLNADGLDAGRYRERFGTDAADDFPDLRAFAEMGLVAEDSCLPPPSLPGKGAGGLGSSLPAKPPNPLTPFPGREGGTRWRPTPLGLERSDALGPWFFSARVRALMDGYEHR